MRPTLLLLATDPDVLIDVASAARQAGFLVAPARYHELGIDALTRVDAEVALVHVQHDAADSIAFRGLAEHLGTKVFLFSRRNGPPEERARVAIVSATSTSPLLEYGLASELIQEMERRARGEPPAGG